MATISAESELLGTIIADTIEKVGKDGVVTVEESQTFGVDSEVVEGLEFDLDGVPENIDAKLNSRKQRQNASKA